MLETFLEDILWNHFQLCRRILNYVSSITKALSLRCQHQSREHVKIGWKKVRRIWRMLQCCHIVLCEGILDQNWPVCWNIVVKKKPTAGSPHFGAFPSNRIARATKDIKVLLCSHRFTISLMRQFVQIIPASSRTFLKLLRTLTCIRQRSVGRVRS
jgi:hypothetical protein